VPPGVPGAEFAPVGLAGPGLGGGPAVTAAQRLAFLFAGAAPHPMLLTGAQREGLAFVPYITLGANGFSRQDLRVSRTQRRQREEQLRILGQAGPTGPPVADGSRGRV
jgi:hypothetical protein